MRIVGASSRVSSLARQFASATPDSAASEAPGSALIAVEAPRQSEPPLQSVLHPFCTLRRAPARDADACSTDPRAPARRTEGGDRGLSVDDQAGALQTGVRYARLIVKPLDP